MGRKNLDEKDKRVVQVNIRLTRGEFEKVSGYACASDLTAANWIRKKVFSGRFPVIKLSPIEATTVQELRRIGVNLNQAMHTIHQGELPGYFLRILLDLKTTSAQIINRLVDDSKHDQGEGF
jgi:hypothetical protein